MVQGISECLDDVLIHRLMAVRGWNLEIVAVLIGHLADGNRVALHTIRGVYGEDARHGQRGHIHRADHHGWCIHLGFVDGLTRGGVMVSQFGRGVRHLAQFEDGAHGGLGGVVRSHQTEERAFRVHRAGAHGVRHVPRIGTALVVVAGEVGRGVRRGGL